ESARQVTWLKGVIAVAPKFSAKFQAVLTAHRAVGILINVAFRRIDALAGDAQSARQLSWSSEAKPGKASIRDARDAELRRELRVVGDAIDIVEAIVSNRQLVHGVIVDGPVVGNAKLRTSHVLNLSRVDRLPGKWREGTSAPVIAVPARPGEGPCQLLPVVDQMIQLDAPSVALQSRAATAELGRVPG